MSKWRENLSFPVAVPKCFGLLTHKTKSGFQIVESKEIPERIPIVCSPLTMFYHEELVNHLQKSRAGIEEVKRVHIFRRASNFSSGVYFTLAIRNKPSFKALMDENFHSKWINKIEGSHNSVFFSRNYYNQVSFETNLLFEEAPIIYLFPLGQDE